MKTKTWTVVSNTGKQADLESGLETKQVQQAYAHQRPGICSLAGA